MRKLLAWQSAARSTAFTHCVEALGHNQQAISVSGERKFEDNLFEEDGEYSCRFDFDIVAYSFVRLGSGWLRHTAAFSCGWNGSYGLFGALFHSLVCAVGMIVVAPKALHSAKQWLMLVQNFVARRSRYVS